MRNPKLKSKFELYRKIYGKINVRVEIPPDGRKPDCRNDGRTTRYSRVKKKNVLHSITVKRGDLVWEAIHVPTSVDS